MEKRILIMDDDKTMREMIGIMLSKLDYEVDHAVNGEQAVEKYTAQPFNLVILDLNIRGGDSGYETFQKLQAYDPNIKAVVISGHVQSPMVLKPRDFGFSGSLAKPFRMETLQEVVRAALSDK
ncbi:MAG TPA: response regulator [Pseudomonadales bacterium]